MLTRRQGIIFFHDVHPKAQRVLPDLSARFETAGVRFADCRQEIPTEGL